jgi:hypothetical protein
VGIKANSNSNQCLPFAELGALLLLAALFLAVCELADSEALLFAVPLAAFFLVICGLIVTRRATADWICLT